MGAFARWSVILCPLERVVRVKPPASRSFAPASQAPLRGLRLSPALQARLYAVCCREFPRSLAALAPGLRRCRVRRRPHAGLHWVLALPWDPAASQHSGFNLFEDLCALVSQW